MSLPPCPPKSSPRTLENRCASFAYRRDSQPIGMGLLSAPEEEQVVRRGFQELEDLGLVTVEYLLRARIDRLHKRLRDPDVDILHFIGHGTYDDERKEGYLIFENSDGGIQRIGSESLPTGALPTRDSPSLPKRLRNRHGWTDELKFDFNRGVAPKLVAEGTLPGRQWNTRCWMYLATEFAKRFYRWLAWAAPWAMPRGKPASP